MLKRVIKSGGISVVGLLTAGCVVYEQPRPVAVVERPVVVDQPVVVEPGVEVVEVEPAPEDRVYVYEVGYPPGVYVYGGFYYYNGQRYEHDVFVNRVVTVNIRENRYVNVEENRRAGRQIEAQHREQYAVNRGRPADAPRGADAARSPAETRNQPAVSDRSLQRTAARPAPAPRPARGGAQASVR